ncbi:hypothetical protein ACJJTC_005821 [Scirpophaga incertulas]
MRDGLNVRQEAARISVAAGVHKYPATPQTRRIYENIMFYICITLHSARPLAAEVLELALERQGQLSVADAVAKSIRRMRDLYRAGGVRGAGTVRKRWQLPSTPGLFFLRPLLIELRSKRASFFCPLHRTPHTR